MKIQCLYALMILLISSCGSSFLDHKYEQSDRVPNRVSDFQAIMDDPDLSNNTSSYRLANIGSDEFSLSDAVWALLDKPYEKNGYYWADDLYQGMTVSDWNTAYHAILRTNLVLDGLGKIKDESNVEWRNVRAQALFVRAYQYFNLLQLFAPPYRNEIADQQISVPLRLTYDITEKGQVVTMRQLYQQVIDDLKTAVVHLPVYNGNLTRASKLGALALLARCHLMQYDYVNAEKMAKAVLDLKPDLIDYNTLPLLDDAQPPFVEYPSYKEQHQEIIYRCSNPNLRSTGAARINISPELLNLYDTADLRKKLFFTTMSDGRVVFKGSYMGTIGSYFNGLAVDEIYLIYAESLTRNGKIAVALSTLNHFRKHRIAKDAYKDIVGANQRFLLKTIYEERRKELVFRGRNWEDLRRLAVYPDEMLTFKRVLNGTVYELKGSDNKATWPIPEDEIQFGFVKQNPR